MFVRRITETGAFRTERGITKPVAADDLVPALPDCPSSPPGGLDDDGTRARLAHQTPVGPEPAPGR